MLELHGVKCLCPRCAANFATGDCKVDLTDGTVAGLLGTYFGCSFFRGPGGPEKRFSLCFSFETANNEVVSINRDPGQNGVSLLEGLYGCSMAVP